MVGRGKELKARRCARGEICRRRASRRQQRSTARVRANLPTWQLAEGLPLRQTIEEKEDARPLPNDAYFIALREHAEAVSFARREQPHVVVSISGGFIVEEPCVCTAPGLVSCGSHADREELTHMPRPRNTGNQVTGRGKAARALASRVLLESCGIGDDVVWWWS